ncbi:MAG: response regulator transcription factor [Anaerolineales bacterium]
MNVTDQEQRKISLVIIDDHPLFRQGVEDVLRLEADFEIVGRASSGEEGLSLIRELHPLIGIIDFNLPDIDGILVVKIVEQEHLPTRMVLLTAYDDPAQLFYALRCGAWGYCTKDIQPSELVKWIRAVSRGYTVVSNQIIPRQELGQWLKSQTPEQLWSKDVVGPEVLLLLSPREMEVLSYLSQGKSNKEIAHHLGISHQTVKNHITSLFRKIGVEDRTQAVLYAIQRGWIRMQTLETKK